VRLIHRTCDLAGYGLVVDEPTGPTRLRVVPYVFEGAFWWITGHFVQLGLGRYRLFYSGKLGPTIVQRIALTDRNTGCPLA
jgi:hypothetical protein